MARFYGEIGYGEPVEDPPDSGVWVDKMTEYPYQGDVIRNTRQLGNAEKVNRDVVVANSISVVADKLANENFFNIKYLRWGGVLWAVTTVEVRSPRLILSLGSVYNGPTA
jgi:hypothetical protein